MTRAIPLAVMMTGCGYGVHVGVGPTVDTFGQVGVECRVTGSFRVALPTKKAALFVGLEAGGGGGLLGHEQVGAGVAYGGFSLSGPARKVWLRGTFHYEGHFFSAPNSVGRLDGVGGGFGAQGVLARIGEEGYVSLGGALDLAWQAGGGEDRGIFFLGVELEVGKLHVPVL